MHAICKVIADVIKQHCRRRRRLSITSTAINKVILLFIITIVRQTVQFRPIHDHDPLRPTVGTFLLVNELQQLDHAQRHDKAIGILGLFELSAIDLEKNARAQARAAQMAIDHINRKRYIPAHYRLTMHVNDSEVS